MMMIMVNLFVGTGHNFFNMDLSPPLEKQKKNPSLKIEKGKIYKFAKLQHTVSKNRHPFCPIDLKQLTAKAQTINSHQAYKKQDKYQSYCTHVFKRKKSSSIIKDFNNVSSLVKCHITETKSSGGLKLNFSFFETGGIRKVNFT